MELGLEYVEVFVPSLSWSSNSACSSSHPDYFAVNLVLCHKLGNAGPIHDDTQL